MPAIVDPLSACSLRLELRANGQPVSVATGFVVEAPGGRFLITNYHVLAGRNPDSSRPLSPTGAIPDEVVITHHASSQVGAWVQRAERLYSKEGKPRWKEHPDGHRVDVAALPLESLDAAVAIYPFDLRLASADVLVQVAMTVSIIGYPLGLATAGNWPIWKTGHIASDPDLDYDARPVFLIDATTRGGMSGSPVILRLHGGYTTTRGSIVMNGMPATRFLGIYSGRIHSDAEIGRVWRPAAIEKILGISI